jgi:hypothetical protein
MPFRFRRSVKIVSGLKTNLNKHGMSLTVGGRGEHHTADSKGQSTTSLGIPGSGLSYQHRSSRQNDRPDAESCPSCGNEVAAGDVFCSRCGVRFASLP